MQEPQAMTLRHAQAGRATRQRADAMVERAARFGSEALSDEELLAILVGRAEGDRRSRRRHGALRTDQMLMAAGGLLGLASRGVHALSEELGLAPPGAARVVAAIELGLRVARRSHPADAAQAGSPEDVHAWARQRLLGLQYEELWALLLDGHNRLLGERLLARGGLHACALRPGDALRPVIREYASAFVLVHNHPSGDPCPSREDVAFTRQVRAAGLIVGVELVDHVVVGRDGYISMLEAGLMDELAT